ncbi:MAG: DUF177 domain-containing protein [Kiritimatiellaeota bacterium]|nr:DUF177 domain-containing protein [Kiritimatiellota bacterium]
MIVDLARLDTGGGRYAGELAEAVLELGDSEVLAPLGGIAYDVSVQLLGDDELLVRGRLRQRLRCVCVRCAADFEGEASDGDFTACVEIPKEIQFLDLTQEVREAIILALPGYPVCREDCKGLCMTCGANLNEAACACHQAGRDNRWAALDTLI